ncbi:MAG: response regulator transcription factor [Crocinitomicaceae bacterium]|nr:response regulator transcription factor [Crocinitomicaceae bacterium]
MIRIALAEDHALLSETLVSVLNGQDNFEVVLTVANGKELIDQLVPSEVDVLLLDIMMPIMTGLEALKYIREHYQDQVKIIMLSMHYDPQFVSRMIDSGANSYLAKLGEPEDLYEGIVKVHETGYFFHDLVSPVMLKDRQNVTLQHNIPLSKIPLNKQEITIIQLHCDRYSVDEIAKNLMRSSRVIQDHKRSIMKKVGVENDMDLMEYAVTYDIYNRRVRQKLAD